MSFNFVIENFIIGQKSPDLSPNFIFYRRGFNLGSGGSGPDWKDIILHGNTALTLVNAKANGLNYLKLFGDTEQLAETYIDSVTLDGKCEQNGTPTPTVSVDIVCNNGVLTFGTGNTYNTADGQGTFVSPNGSTTTRIYKAFGKLKAGKYKVKITGDFEFIFQYKDAPDQSYTQYGNMGTWVTEGEYEITDTSLYYGVAIRNNYNGNISPSDFNNIGSIGYSYLDVIPVGTVETATDNVGNVATAQMLLSVGNYKDTQEVLTGAVTRNVGIKVLDGTEDWEYSAGWSKTNTNVYYCYVPDGAKWSIPPITQKLTYYTHFQSVSRNELYELDSMSAGWSDGLRAFAFTVRIDKTMANNLTAWKAWLASQYANGTPVIIVYPINSATTSTVTGQFLSKEPVTVTGSLTGLVANVVSSSHTTPTPQQPLQINCNNGVVKVSPNLFDINDLNIGSVAEDIVKYKSYAVPNGTYTMSTPDFPTGSNTANIFFLAGDVSSGASSASNGVLQGTSRTINVSDGYYTIGYRSGASNPNNPKNYSWQIELGPTATPYIPYGQIYTDGTTEMVEVTGKNLFDGAYENGIYNVADGTKSVTANRVRSQNFIDVQPSTAYTFSFVGDTVSNGDMRVLFYQQNGTYIGNANNSFKVTTPNNCYKMTFFIAQNFTVETAPTCQVEQGSTATTYEEYFDGGSATAEMLLKVGDYQDIQSVLDGAVTRNVGVKVLDGTENWQNISGYFNILKTDIGSSSTVLPSNSTNIICSHFETKTGEFTNGIGAGGSYVNFKYDSIATTLTVWKQWLSDQYNAGTPVIIVYPLATATTESVTAQPLTIQAGTNIVEITQASMDDLELEVSYKAGVEVTVTEIENAQLDNSVEVTING